MRELEKWFSVLMPKVQPHLYGRGGNVILVQVENEYGSFGCDIEYRKEMKELYEKYIKSDALLFTNDGGYEMDMPNCGHINGTVTTADFGTEWMDYKRAFGYIRQVYPHGPLVDSEFYTGWIMTWGQKYPDISSKSVSDYLEQLLAYGVNVNMYMFFGGTNFAFTSGAVWDPQNGFYPVATSYDYDAPLNEAGDVTEKYWAIRNVTSKFVNITTQVPENTKKLTLPEFKLIEVGGLLDDRIRQEVCSAPVNSPDPLQFEHFGQRGGFLIHETNMPVGSPDENMTLHIGRVRDRALVYLDDHLLGSMCRIWVANDTLHFVRGHVTTLRIIVEDQGRIDLGDWSKGISGVTINGKPVVNWMTSSCPFVKQPNLKEEDYTKEISTPETPTFHSGEFNLAKDQVLDTFMDMRGWSKGVAYINGHNLGRYWSSLGPQMTLYVPKEFLLEGVNSVLLLELEVPKVSGTVQFLDHGIYKP